MRTVIRALAAILPLSLVLAGCGSDYSAPLGSPAYITGDLGTLTYRAVDRIVAEANGTPIGAPLVVTSLSDVQNLDASSALGNIVAEMVRNRLVQDGYATAEIRLRNAVEFQKNEGEFLLSRNWKAIPPPREVTAIVTGTYSATPEKVYISLKFISAIDGRIIAGTDYVVPYSEVAALLDSHRT